MMNALLLKLVSNLSHNETYYEIHATSKDLVSEDFIKIKILKEWEIYPYLVTEEGKEKFNWEVLSEYSSSKENQSSHAGFFALNGDSEKDRYFLCVGRNGHELVDIECACIVKASSYDLASIYAEKKFESEGMQYIGLSVGALPTVKCY